jgi:hypothetical protein
VPALRRAPAPFAPTDAFCVACRSTAGSAPCGGGGGGGGGKPLAGVTAMQYNAYRLMSRVPTRTAPCVGVPVGADGRARAARLRPRLRRAIFTSSSACWWIESLLLRCDGDGDELWTVRSAQQSRERRAQ